jgi:hypothetical protein
MVISFENRVTQKEASRLLLRPSEVRSSFNLDLFEEESN